MITIRQQQMEALREYMRRNFEDRAVKHVAVTFPQEYEEMLDPKEGDKKVRELVREGVRKASSYRIRSEQNVLAYISLMVGISPDFDESEDMAWARAILADEKLDEDTKMELIYGQLQAKEEAGRL